MSIALGIRESSLGVKYYEYRLFVLLNFNSSALDKD